MRTRVLEIDGLQVVARIHGSGPQTYVLVHGLGMSSYYFRPLAERLARRGTVVSVNLPGFGPTRDPDKTLRIGQFARVAHQATDRLGLGPAVWVGHSMGTQIVTEVALQRPDLVQRLVLLAPVVNEAEKNFLTVCLRFTQAAVHETLPSVFATARAFLRAGPRYVAEMVPALLNHPLSRRLAQVSCPVVLVVGEKDALTPPDWVARLRQCNPGTTSHTVFGASHQMMHTHADETVAVIAADETPPWRPRLRQLTGELLRGLRPGRRIRSTPSGSPVLLLHGLLERPGHLWRLADHLGAHGHRVITVPGLGWNIGSLERGWRAALEALGEHRDVVVVAHSKGGLIGKRLLLEAGDQVRGMVTVATPFQGSVLATGFSRTPLLRRTPLGLFDPEGDELRALAADADVDHRIVSLIPTRDPIIPDGSHLAGATNVTLPQVGHFAPLQDEEVWALIRHHVTRLAEHSPGGG
ncbi:alpha/beta hydrolase [Arachnia propionica]|uniref:Alpha/beta hydrolase n=1 Tax=Arachnia propionica TaxID=1750 RepID=A0A3P1T8B8_9ACTN|nr:alpha/beta fold hydrolase [Arachnia propionica]MDO5082187.1 alpha/beta fold hydrolase [Arachnia propionica]RRD05737.1 alpha/beta hydrolase [Arachnia propionica]